MFGRAKDVCPNIPKLTQEAFFDFCLQIFCNEDHEEFFGVTSKKRSLYVFLQILCANFFQSFRDFQFFCPEFPQNKTFYCALARYYDNSSNDSSLNRQFIEPRIFERQFIVMA